ncbi:MAG: Xenobiotic-transporting ATPase [Firmicutes bacterium]|nr:Xenobiotic-transporting ATPase [Bacillota bacterium]
MHKLRHGFFRGMWNLTKQYWRSEERWRAFGLLAAIVILTLGHVYMLVQFNEWYNEFYSAIQNYDQDGFFAAIKYFIILAAIYIIVAVYEIYLRQMLEIKWRNWLTRYYLGHWLNKRAYYFMQVFHEGTDNPDQRISEDIRLFVSMALSLSIGLLKAVVTLVSFVVILWKLSGVLTVPFAGKDYVIPGYMVWLSLIYAVIGTWLTVKIGRPLVKINFNQQRYEADFRFGLVRLRENSESIAFYNGEKQEAAGLTKRFVQVVGNYWTLMRRQKKLTWFTAGYGQLAVIFPLLMAAPRYFSKNISLGGLLQTTSAFGRVQDALSYFVDNYSTLAEWLAVVNRLLGFVEDVNKVQKLATPSDIMIDYTADNVVGFKGFDVYLPNGEVLLSDLAINLKAGDSLLITGQSGAGKSTLLRTLAGIWPFCRGKLVLPKAYDALFLPQKPYLPLGSLRDCLLYPGTDGVVSDDVLKKVLVKCRLEGLIDELDKVDNWQQILSLGEQQRIAFARALIGQPTWLFLDEATSGLDEELEAVMYALVQNELPETAIISVGHRNTLVDYHQMKLHFMEKGHWQLLAE